jgi:WD40 repeat protein
MPVDPATGTPTPGYAAVDMGVSYYPEFSPDRSTVAVVSFNSDSPANPLLHLIDLRTWKETTFPLDAVGWVNAFAFSPDGARLAISLSFQKPELLVFDLAKGAVIAQARPEYEISRLRFTADGTSLMAYGRRLVDRFTENEHTEGPARVSIFSASDLAVQWSAELAGVRDGIFPLDPGVSSSIHMPGSGTYLIPGVVFAPDQELLFIVHADEDKLTTVDFARRSSRTHTFRPHLSWFERFLMLGAGVAHAKVADGTSRQAVLSPDGATLYVVGVKNRMVAAANGEWKIEPSSLHLQVLRAEDATVMLEKQVFASSAQMSPDGGRVFLQSWKENAFYGDPSTEVLDVQAGDFTAHYEGIYLSPARRMDGTYLLASAAPYSNSGQSTRMAVYDLSGTNLLGEWTSPTYSSWISPP